MKTIGQKGIQLIKEFEGLKLQAYLCPALIPTIGYGHTKTVTQADVKNKKTITKEVAEVLLKGDLVSFERCVNRVVKVDLNQNQFDALVSLAFNIGVGAFSRSTLMRRLNESKYEIAAEQFAAWRMGGGKILPGLVRRRAAERQLFLSI